MDYRKKIVQWLLSIYRLFIRQRKIWMQRYGI